MLDYYKPSGKFSPITFIYFLLVCAVIMPILGAIYTYAMWYIPIIYVNLLIIFGFGVSISFVVSLLVIRLRKVRNYGLSVFFTIITSLVTYYSQWVIWVGLILSAREVCRSKQMDISVNNVQFEQLLYLTTHPSDLIDLIMLINEGGTWGIKSMTISGIFLSTIWLIEFGATTFFGFMAAGRSKVPFSEVTEERFREEGLPAFTYMDNPSSFKQAAEQGNWEASTGTLQLADRRASHSLFTAHISGNNYYLSVYNAKAKINSKGKVEFDTDEFMKYLHINETIYDMLRARA